MVLAYHLIFTAYGWWLPNDPRGSSSHSIRSDVIAQLGELHYGRKRVQPTGAEIREFYARARHCLAHELRTFDARSRRVIADAFGDAIRRYQYTCYACAIMPDHVHVLIRKHRDKAETMIANLQMTSRTHLIETGVAPPAHPVWGGPGWKVYLDGAQDIERTVKYIVENPIPYRLPIQRHPFVTAYDGWIMAGAARSRRPSN